jgi:hypothetical protein
MKNLSKNIGVILGVSLSVFLISFVVFAEWQDPTDVPPNANVPAPVTSGSDVQYKEGALGVGGVFETDTHTHLAIDGGNVGIGTASPGHLLDVDGDIFTSGVLYATGSATSSDIAYKENITSLSYGLSDVLKISPREFDMKKSGEHRISFIAQELEDIIPEVVNGEEGSKGVYYGEMTAVLINAIKEQQEMIEEQEERIRMLEDKINE